jgi:membrane protease YdiL (CAAX protease family)
MVMTFATVARFAGLGVALAALIRETLALRAPGTLPIARLVRRELAAKPRPGQLAICLMAGALVVVVPVMWSATLGTAEVVLDPQWRSVSIVALIATLAIKVLWVFFEELAFRAALIKSFAGRIGVPAAIALSAVAFATAHGRDAVSAAVLVVDGIGFGVAYAATGSIRAPIAWHLAKNLAVWLVTDQSTMQFASSPWRLTGVPSTGIVDLGVSALVVGLTSALLLGSRRSALSIAS